MYPHIIFSDILINFATKIIDIPMLYIHVPYCRRKCIYCDFFSGGARIADWEGLNNALISEFRLRINELPSVLRSVYIGGGTPSLMPSQHFLHLIDSIKDLILLNNNIRIDEDLEFTIEVNPEDVDDEHIMAWKRAGVNRVSIGIQSLSAEVLSRMGRTHSPRKAKEALKLLTQNFTNVSADLIFGFPGVTCEQLNQDISLLCDIGVTHISLYSIMYEEGTALTHLRDEGRFEEMDEESINEQYRLITEKLRERGLEHYEISNYAFPGYRSQHNSGYWTGNAYLGIGPSAHSYDGLRIRRANPPKLKEYLNYFSSNCAKNNSDQHFYQEEILSDKEIEEEFIMLSLRRKEGINLTSFKLKFGVKELDKFLRRSSPYIQSGLLIYSLETVSLSEDGIMIADEIISSLLPD